MPTPPTIFSTPKGGLYGGYFDATGLDPNVRATLMNERWTTSFDGPQPATVISYAFPTQATDYTKTPGYNAADLIASFQPLTEFQKAAARIGFDLVASYTGLTFKEVAPGSDAAFRFAHFDDSGSRAFFPMNDGAYEKVDSRTAGDVFLGSNGTPPSAAFFGTDHFTTIIHEMGHAFGLKHGHDNEFNGALAPRFNDNEFSVMTYASYFGANTGGSTEARPGSSPQSYMMFDIAALQALYGANFSKVGSRAVYSWDAGTGQEFINGAAAPDTGVTATGKIFSTVWTQGATSTYNLGNFSQDQVDDLRPGHWLKFSTAQLADLNKDVPADTAGYIAQGNVYNALLYQGDLRSAVANLTTGSGNDTLIGNDRDNVLTAGAGNDIIVTGGGNDTVSGGAGADKIYFGSGHSALRDSVADLNGDMVKDFGFGGVDVLGARMAWGNVAITASITTISVGGSTVQLEGNFSSGGEFMLTPRGSGADAHTALNYVNYLPGLSEGVSVNPASINGIVNQSFLTGDSSVHFTVDLKTAISAFSNTLGVYKVAADGTISSVHVLFANTHNVAPGGNTIDLGVPGNGERIGFFLIQNGADFGNLPDNLSFVAPGTTTVANVNNWMPATLISASHGVLGGHQIFHSFASLNPGGAVQVLSGTTPGGREVQIGFEDLPNATSDKDFQDVVVGIHVTGDGFLLT